MERCLGQGRNIQGSPAFKFRRIIRNKPTRLLCMYPKIGYLKILGSNKLDFFLLLGLLRQI